MMKSKHLKNKIKIAIVRGKFLNRYEMQTYEYLPKEFNIIGFSSLYPIHSYFNFPVKKLPSPMDLPDFPYKMPILNRLFIDAHYLFGLENSLRGFDIAHSAETYFHYTNQCLNVKKKGYVKKVIVTVWENIPFANEAIWGRKGYRKRAVNEADYFIAVSQKSKGVLLEEGVEENRISVISPGIDTSVFKPRQKFNYSMYLNILFVGRLEKYKGVYDVIFAAKQLSINKDLKDYFINFTLIGNGSERYKILGLIKRLGMEKFVIIKQVSYDKIREEYRNADIFVAPSKDTNTWREQYNMALLEAQSCGLPIITTRAGSIPENVNDAAILIDQGDLLALVKEMKKMIIDSNIREEYSKRARNRALSFHDAKVKAKQIANIYREVLSK